jgi:hypothetical protein
LGSDLGDQKNKKRKRKKKRGDTLEQLSKYFLHFSRSILHSYLVIHDRNQ